MDEQNPDGAPGEEVPLLDMDDGSDPAPEEVPAIEEIPAVAEEPAAAQEAGAPEEDPEAAMAAAMAAEMGLSPDGGATPEPEVEASAPTFEELGEALPGSQPAALALLYDLDLPVAIELGRTRLSVQDVLGLGRGSVVQLERQAGEPVDVYVGDRRFAEGEVVIVGEQFGVRITRIVSTAPIGAAAKV